MHCTPDIQYDDLQVVLNLAIINITIIMKIQLSLALIFAVPSTQKKISILSVLSPIYATAYAAGLNKFT